MRVKNETMQILAVVLARAGSKGIPGKNVKIVCGKPLIRHTVEQALGATSLNGIVVSSDSKDTLDAAGNDRGLSFVLRPRELAEDNTPAAESVIHAVHEYEKKCPDAGLTHVMLLQPTSPLRTSADIDKAAAVMRDHPRANTLISAYDATHVHPAIMYQMVDADHCGKIPGYDVDQRRQDFKKIFVRNGAIYLARRDFLLRERRLFCDEPLLYEMPRSRSINVDAPFDLHLVQLLLTTPFSGDE